MDEQREGSAGNVVSFAERKLIAADRRRMVEKTQKLVDEAWRAGQRPDEAE